MQAKIKIIVFIFSLLLINKIQGQGNQGNYKEAMDMAYKCFIAQNWDCAILHYTVAKDIAIDRRLSEEDRKKADTELTKSLAAKFSPQVKNENIEGDRKFSTVDNFKVLPKPPTQLSQFNYAIQLEFPSNYFSNSVQNLNSLVESIKSLIFKTNIKQINAWKDVYSDNLFYNEEFRLQGANRKDEAHFLYDSTLKVISQLDNIPEQLLNIHLRTALYYCWDLLDKAASNTKILESVKNVIQNSINIASKFQYNSPKAMYARAGFENLLRAFCMNMNDGNGAYKHGLLAVEYISKAAKEEPNNAYYWSSLYVYVRNLKSLPDTTISQSAKSSLAELSYTIASYLEKFPISNLEQVNSILLSIKLSSLNDKYNEYIAIKKYSEALNILQIAINKKESKLLSVNLENAPIYVAVIYNRIANLHNHYIKDPTLYKTYTKGAADTILYFLRNNKLSQYRWSGWFQGAIDDIILNSEFILSKEERKTLAKSLVEAIQSGNNDYFDNQEISYAYSNANSLLASMLLSNKIKSDSIQALTYLSHSIEIFEKGNFLEKYSSYSEDYAKYCNPFSKIIKIYSSQGDFIMAKKYYESMMKYFKPIIDKYGFDFYFMQHIIAASESYGEFLFKTKRFKEAIAPLQLSSYEGIKQSTEYLIEIYANTNLKNKNLLDSFTLRNTMQSKNMKRFTVPIECGGIKQPFHVYVMDRAKGHPYMGIQDQVKWVKEARGCDVPEDVVASFNKLQLIAWEKNVSFQDLCLYALGERNNEKLGTTYMQNPKRELTPQEEYNIKKNSVEYLSFGTKPETLIAYYKWYLEDKDFERADSLLDVMLKSSELNKTDIRFYLKIIYTLKTDDEVCKKLLMYDRQNPRQMFYFSLIVGDTVMKTNNQKWANYLNIVAVDSLYKLSFNNDTFKLVTANAYNSLGWLSLLTKRYTKAEHYLRKSIELNPNSPFAKGNLAHAYLLNNQYEKAKMEYLKLKDEPIIGDTRFKTLKEAFLDDFKEFEKAGIYNGHFKEIKRLLEE